MQNDIKRYILRNLGPSSSLSIPIHLFFPIQVITCLVFFSISLCEYKQKMTYMFFLIFFSFFKRKYTVYNVMHLVIFIYLEDLSIGVHGELFHSFFLLAL